MSPLYETSNRSLSPSLRFTPSLTCIAEEEPRAVAIRRITVPSEQLEVEIPIYDVNIYEPEPPAYMTLPASYQRLLSEMEKFIENQKNVQKYKEMANNLRRQSATEQAESIRRSKSNFTHRDWYWYSEQTRTFVEKPINHSWGAVWKNNNNKNLNTTTPTTPTGVSAETIEDGFDLNADF